MALKSLLFVSLVVAAAIAPMVDAQLGIISSLVNLIYIQGTLYCTPNGNVGVNGSATPVFPNAGVQLKCGENVVSTATTNGAGLFLMVLDPLQFLLSTLLTNCNLEVKTPLASCDAKLPSVGTLLSPLLSIGNTLLGFLNITNIVPAGFQFIPRI
ncbi:phylloplanin-like [Mangifera indica]|uniref:phylloplanin-like n=1 Tax=Mangifera indica TaxID=29780 RepID=UPI001CFC3101|nr:phylloplanin-like [Mangifera indica]